MTSKKRLIFSYGILALLLAVLFAANLFWGSVALTPSAVLAALTGSGQDALSVSIITRLRLPRAVMVVLLGAAASSGAYYLCIPLMIGRRKARVRIGNRREVKSL